MTGIGASAALAVLTGWVVFALASWVVAPGIAAGIGAAAGAVLVLAFRDSVAAGGAVALLAPMGVMLPALALRDVAVRLGLPVPGFATWEIAAFFVLYTGFLAAAFGVVPADPYRLGYAPVPVAAMVLALCSYALLTGNWFLALVAVLGQAGWVIGWGSSNWFDHVLHVALWPVAAVVMIARLI